MFVESGGADLAVPPTIRALLAARLDQLDSAERSLLERASVEGEVFHRGAVQALAPEEEQLTTRLMALVRKELFRPDQSRIAGEDAYRFRHLLIRDTAYEAMPKTVRADLHKRFAIWVEEHGRDLVELDELIGYHLEQAHGYRAALGPLDEDACAIGAGGRAAGVRRATGLVRPWGQAGRGQLAQPRGLTPGARQPSHLAQARSRRGAAVVGWAGPRGIGSAGGRRACGRRW